MWFDWSVGWLVDLIGWLDGQLGYFSWLAIDAARGGGHGGGEEYFCIFVLLRALGAPTHPHNEYSNTEASHGNKASGRLGE